MFSSNSFWCNNTWVICLEGLWLNECVLVSWNKLSLIVGWPITNHDLRWVFIWHDHGWLRKSWSECIWVIWLKWFLQHTSMEILSNLELILGEGSYFWKSLAVKVNWLGSSICECKAYSLSILLKNFTAWCNLGILEHLGWVSYLFLMDGIISIKSILSGSIGGFLFCSLFGNHCFWQGHFDLFFFNLKILNKSTINYNIRPLYEERII